MIPSWWSKMPLPGNFGDVLTPYLVRKITGASPTWVDKSFKKYKKNLLSVGSTIQFANQNTIVWGSGAMKITDIVSPLADYRAVRGPLTRSVILKNGGKCPEIYGDPGLLLPNFYKPTIEKKYKIGITPHYVDYEQVNAWYAKDSNISVIDLLNVNIEQVIDQLFQCEKIVSSSLHGLIVSNAYGIDASWVKFSDKLFGDDTKFKDYYTSIGVELVDFTFISEKLTEDQLNSLNYYNIVSFDSTPLLNAFPSSDFT